MRQRITRTPQRCRVITIRVKFWHPERESAPLQGQAILYLGPADKAFVTEFKAHGHTWVAL